LFQIGDKLIRLREAFDNLGTTRSGKLSLAEIKMAFRIHVHRDLTGHDLRAICSSHGVNAPLADLPLDQIYVSFDEFCSLVSEYKNKLRSSSDHHHHHRSHHSSHHHYHNTAKVRESMVNKTVHFFAALVQPVNRAAAWLAAAATPRSRTFSGSGVAAAMGRRGSAVRDVYLGGSSGDPDASSGGGGWREQLAIPMLKKSGLTFYNPAVCSSRRLIPIEASAMDNSRVLLFAILGKDSIFCRKQLNLPTQQLNSGSEPHVFGLSGSTSHRYPDQAKLVRTLIPTVL
jgi:hypothetical protein